MTQCPDCGDLKVGGKPCRYCEPDDAILAGVRRRERDRLKKAPTQRKRPRSLVPRLLGLLSLGNHMMAEYSTLRPGALGRADRLDGRLGYVGEVAEVLEASTAFAKGERRSRYEV